MLSVSKISTQPLPFKQNDRNFVVKIGRKFIDGDSYVRDVDCEIFSQALKNPEINIAKTYNFALAQLQAVHFKTEQNIYADVIKRCFNDIDEAVLNKAPQEKIDKLTETLELFIKKYGYLAK